MKKTATKTPYKRDDKAPKKTASTPSRKRFGLSEADEVFLSALAECGHVGKSAKAAGYCRRTVYARRQKDTRFAELWDKAAEIGVAGLEDEARRRAFEGWHEPVHFQGRATGKIRKYSDTLLIFLLKAARPEKYRDNARVEVTGDGGGALTVSVISFVDALAARQEQAQQQVVDSDDAGDGS
jgi:hypothetical protein